MSENVREGHHILPNTSLIRFTSDPDKDSTIRGYYYLYHQSFFTSTSWPFDKLPATSFTTRSYNVKETDKKCKK